MIERAIVLGSGDVVVPEDLPEELFESGDADAKIPQFHEAVVAAKKEVVEKAFPQAAGDLKRAADISGVHPRFSYRLARNLKLAHLLNN